MPTQEEVEAGAAFLHKKFDEYMPSMMRSRVTGQMEFDLSLGTIEAAERVRKKSQKK